MAVFDLFTIGDIATCYSSSPTPASNYNGAFFKIKEDVKASSGLNLFTGFFYNIPFKNRFASFDKSKVSKSI